MRQRLIPLAFAAALVAPSPSCSLALDFDDECSVDSDCEAVGRGLRCDVGFCVKRDLLDPSGPCDRLFGEDPRVAAPGTVILLGTLLPKSGALGTQGQPMQNGVELAVAEINQVGGVLGRKLGVVACDSGTDAAQAVVAARHLVDVADVKAIVGAGASGVTIEVFNQVAKAANVLMVSPSSTSPAITNLPDEGLLWRTAPSDAIQGRAIAGYLLEHGFSKVAVINRDDAYGNGLALVVQQELCRVVACDPANLKTGTYPADFDDPLREERQATLVSELIDFAPDVVVLVAFVQDGVRFLNLAAPNPFSFVLTDGMKDTSLLGDYLLEPDPEQAGIDDDRLLCAIVGTNPGAPAGEAFQTFAVKYNGAFGEFPRNFEAKSYDALYAIGLAYAAAQGANVPFDAIDGRVLAEGMARLSAGTSVRFGQTEWGIGVTELSSGPSTTVDIIGASGALDFNSAAGEASGSIDLWRLDLDAPTDDGKIEELGVVLDDAGEYREGLVVQREPGDVCLSVR